MGFTTHTVGRSSFADIQINHQSISRLHVEVTHTSTGRIYCVDRNSTHGTFVLENNQWCAFKQGFLTEESQVMLGEKPVLLKELLLHHSAQAHKYNAASAKEIEPISVKPRRNVKTGEVERDK